MGWFDKIREKLVNKLLTEEDIVNSKTYQDFLKDYKETHKEIRELLRKFRDFQPATPYEDINLISDGPAIRDEIAQLEKIITGKDDLIILERQKLRRVKEDLKKIEEHYQDYLPPEILYAVFLHVHEPMIALDSRFNIIDFTHESAEYFGKNIRRDIAYHELFSDIREYNGFTARAEELKDRDYFRMKIQFKEKDTINTRTEPAYDSEKDVSNGYVTTLETEGKLRSLLNYVTKIVQKTEKPVITKPVARPVAQN